MDVLELCEINISVAEALFSRKDRSSVTVGLKVYDIAAGKKKINFLSRPKEENPNLVRRLPTAGAISRCRRYFLSFPFLVFSLLSFSLLPYGQDTRRSVLSWSLLESVLGFLWRDSET